MTMILVGALAGSLARGCAGTMRRPDVGLFYSAAAPEEGCAIKTMDISGLLFWHVLCSASCPDLLFQF